jgi:hypothetical protein
MEMFQVEKTIYELRKYFALPGKWEELLEQFDEHLVAIFERHGITSHGYWRDLEQPDVLVYLVSHNGDPEENWNAFRVDPRWIAIRDASSTGANWLVSSIESTRLAPTSFSPLG